MIIDCSVCCKVATKYVYFLSSTTATKKMDFYMYISGSFIYYGESLLEDLWYLKLETSETFFISKFCFYMREIDQSLFHFELKTLKNFSRGILKSQMFTL